MIDESTSLNRLSSVHVVRRQWARAWPYIEVTKPTGMWGYVQRKALERWLHSSRGKKELERFGLELKGLLKFVGDPKRVHVTLRLGFAQVSLIVTLK